MAKNDMHAGQMLLQRAMAYNFAEDYCRSHNLSVEKLKTQRFEAVADMLLFAQPAGIQPDGLKNDLATQPLPTLVISLSADGVIQVTPTEHTHKYLAN